MPQVIGGNKELNDILEGVYTSCMNDHNDKGKCSAIAWSAAKAQGWTQSGDKWVKNTAVDGGTAILTEVFEKDVKFADGDLRPPKEWFEKCLAKNGDKANPSAYCGFLWSSIVTGQGADPQEVLKNSDIYKNMFDKTKEFIKQFAETQMLKDEEIFAVGKWNGDTYTHEDLKEIAENFNKLQAEVKPPLKIGHSENQKLLQEDGLPAAGWITKLKVSGEKLLADFSDMPKKIYELIKNRAYRRKSAEIYPTYTDSSGKKYGKVLRAVAILGGDTPAVTTIGDIHALYKDKGNQEFKIYDTEGGERIVKTLSMSVSGEQFGEDFATKFNSAMKTAFGEGVTVKFEGDEGGGDAETIKALRDKIVELEKQLEDHDMEEMKAKYDETVKVLNETKTKLADAEGKAAKLTDTETKLTEAQTKLQENEVKAHKAEVKAFIEKAKTEGKIIPANEPMVTALMEQIDGKAVIKFTEKDKDGKDVQVEKSPLELVKKFVESLPKLVEFKEVSGDKKEILTFTAEDGEVKIGNTVYKVDDLDLASKAKKYSQEHNVTLEVAIVEVSK